MYRKRESEQEYREAGVLDEVRKGNDPLSRSLPGDEPRSLFTVKKIDQWTVIEFTDLEELYDEDMVREIGDCLQELVERGHDRMVIDFGKLRYISSYMLAQLVWIHRKIGKSQGALRLCQLDPFVRNLFRICHLDHILTGIDRKSGGIEGARCKT